MAAADRVFDIIEREPDIREPADPLPCSGATSGLENVSLPYAIRWRCSRISISMSGRGNYRPGRDEWRRQDYTGKPHSSFF